MKLKAIFIFVFGIAVIMAHSQTTRIFELYSMMNGTIQLADGSVTHIWGFGHSTNRISLPAPTLTVNEGDTVVIHMHNPSLEGHTIHLHGLDVDQANDGVPQTSSFVLTGDSTTYTFVAKDAGSYLYHCHVTSTLHLQMGMYGALIVKAANGAKTAFTNGPSFTREYMWLTSELDKSWHDDYTLIGSLTNYSPDYFLVNGKSDQQISADANISIAGKVGDTVYVRLINIGFEIHEFIFPESLNARIITSDGRPLPSKVASDTVTVFTGERYGVLLTLTEEMNDMVEVNYHSMYRKTYRGSNQIPVSVSPAGIEEMDMFTGFKIFPNPGKGRSTIVFEDKQQREIIITDQLGQLISRQKNTEKEEELYFPGKGFYFVTSSSSDSHHSQKVIVY